MTPVNPTRRGFANPEIMLLIVAILIGLAIAVPAFARAREKRRNFHALNQLRAAIQIYSDDTKTKGPPTLEELTKGGKYLSAIPTVSIMGQHSASAQVKLMGVTDDAGGWSYSSWPGDARQGEVWINCTHTDSTGKAWKDY